MSIPRDSIVDIPGKGTTKINAAYAYGGPKLLIRTIEQNTGIKIDHYVEIGFGGFVDVVDAVGGIEICPTRKMKDKQANLDIDKGCQEADGVTALGYARSRKTDPRFGDITRARHQREVVSAIGQEATSPWTIINPVRYYRVNMAGAKTFSVDEGTGPIDLGRFAWAMTRVDGEERPDLRGADPRPRGQLGRGPVEEDVRAHHRRRHRGHRQGSLHAHRPHQGDVALSA